MQISTETFTKVPSRRTNSRALIIAIKFSFIVSPQKENEWSVQKWTAEKFIPRKTFQGVLFVSINTESAQLPLSWWKQEFYFPRIENDAIPFLFKYLQFNLFLIKIKKKNVLFEKKSLTSTNFRKIFGTAWKMKHWETNEERLK